MKILVNGTAYTCTGRPSLCDPVRFSLPDGQPDVAALGATVSLQDDSGFVLCEIPAAGYARKFVEGTSLVLTNTPEPEAVEETPEAMEPTAQEDANSLLVDHEYRLTLLELGVK